MKIIILLFLTFDIQIVLIKYIYYFTVLLFLSNFNIIIIIINTITYNAF